MADIATEPGIEAIDWDVAMHMGVDDVASPAQMLLHAGRQHDLQRLSRSLHDIGDMEARIPFQMKGRGAHVCGAHARGRLGVTQNSSCMLYSRRLLRIYGALTDPRAHVAWGSSGTPHGGCSHPRLALERATKHTVERPVPTLAKADFDDAC